MIRLVRESGLTPWRELRANLYTEMTQAENPAETLAMLEPAPRQCVFAYEENGDVIGMVEVGLRDYAEGCNTSPVGYIEGWSVREDARRRGIGRALFAAAEERQRHQHRGARPPRLYRDRTPRLLSQVALRARVQSRTSKTCRPQLSATASRTF